jgi:RNA ligase
MIHPAHTMPFDELAARLKAAREQRLVYERTGPDDLVLYVYSEHCVFDGAWDAVTTAARGLILDHAARHIVATPFPKFFNAGERGEPIPDLPFDTFEKLDGSLIILFHHRGRWRTTTKGAFDSAQAKWAQARIDRMDTSPLVPGVTYLAEATYPENRIVVRHDVAALRLLGAYDSNGVELSWDAVVAAAASIGLGTPARTQHDSVAELLALAKTLPQTDEGFVVRFENGLRLKIKGAEYKRIHALISGLTPLNMWEAMANSMDMQQIRRDLPEEFWGDFDRICALIQAQVTGIVAQVEAAARTLAGLSDKDVGLRLATLAPAVKPFIFDYRKSGGKLLDGRSREKVFRLVRPTANVLPGYVPSHAINRVADESG